MAALAAFALPGAASANPCKGEEVQGVSGKVIARIFRFDVTYPSCRANYVHRKVTAGIVFEKECVIVNPALNSCLLARPIFPAWTGEIQRLKVPVANRPGLEVEIASHVSGYAVRLLGSAKPDPSPSEVQEYFRQAIEALPGKRIAVKIVWLDAKTMEPVEAEAAPPASAAPSQSAPGT